VETELVKRAQHGDREAFGLIAADIATRFLAISRRILRDLDLAEDATQQALVAVWRDLPQLRDPARFDAWSYRLLVHACYAEGRGVRHWSPNLRQLPEDALAASNTLDEVILRDQLETAIRRLSVDHRTVLVLHHYADIPAERVAEIVGVPIGTVYSRLHHAMRALRAALEADARPAAAEASR
jgi:RNA polymerase sigma-70 factor (ECF subfamily)